MIMRKAASARYGCRSWLDNRGHAGSNVGASFQACPIPKLKALIAARPLASGCRHAAQSCPCGTASRHRRQDRHAHPSRAALGKHKHCANAAINIDPAVGTGGPGHVGQFTKCFFALVQILRQRGNIRARSWKVMARNAGPPFKMACWRMATTSSAAPPA